MIVVPLSCTFGALLWRETDKAMKMREQRPRINMKSNAKRGTSTSTSTRRAKHMATTTLVGPGTYRHLSRNGEDMDFSLY
jgi:hypothetical protein